MKSTKNINVNNKEESKNPLLETSPLPHQALQFDSIKEEHYLPAISTAIEMARENIEKIRSNPDQPTFENTIVALETASEKLGSITAVFYNQLSANGSDKMEELAQEIGPINAAFSSDILEDKKLFERIKHVYDMKDKLNLTPEEQTLLEDTYKNFVRGGALLGDKAKQRLRKIKQELSTLSPEFANNVTKATKAFELVIESKEELAGLPQSAIDGAKHAAEEKGYKSKWLFTLDAPSLIPFLTFADKRDLRKKIWYASSNRAYGDKFDNCENIRKITALRDEKAKLLGYKNHAEFVLERRMAKTPEKVLDFIKEMKDRYKPAAINDLEELKKLAKTDGIDEIKPWDISYYSEKLKQKLFNFSSEDLRPYFQLENVLEGVFSHFEKLFSLKFVESEKYPTWHKDVKAYEVYDEEKQKLAGILYTDFFPRKSKKGGAWETGYRDQGISEGKIKCPIVSIVCNFTKPTGEKPSLLTFGEVQTLFHEMGHATHALLSDVTYQSCSGTNVLWDFVELPSQLQENWTYEQETLNSFATHFETGEKIPAELIEKLNRAKNFMAGWRGLTQMKYAITDMAWHTNTLEKNTDIAEFEDKAVKDYTIIPRLAAPMSTTFSHIFAGGYSAGYYSYKWAEVLDADAFESFRENGLYNQKTAKRLKTEILSKGGSEQPETLYKNFKGRPADPKALLRREGLA